MLGGVCVDDVTLSHRADTPAIRETRFAMVVAKAIATAAEL
jgi:hypothetical protein